jgi:serine/threonine protein kinase
MKAFKQLFFIDKGGGTGREESASTQNGDVEVLPQTQKSRHQLLPESTPTPLQAERLSEEQAAMTLKAERLLEERARAKEAEEEREHVQVGIGGTLGPDSSFPQGRYVVRQLLGKGVYGKVFECEDLAEGRLVAVKVSRDHEWVRDAALKEIQLLRKLKGACGVLCYYNNFSHLRHVGIAVELCGENLKTKLGRVGALTLEQVADVGLQILHGIQYMHAWGYVHADLKPENVLVYNRGLENDVVERPLTIRIADLGSALFNEESFRPERGTKEYCAPEVVLKTGWSYEVDLWAIGCVLAELFTGKKLFCADLDCNVHLMIMQKRLGRTLPQTLLRKAWEQGKQQVPEIVVPIVVQGYCNVHDGLRINPMITDVLQEKKLREGSYVLSEVVSNPLLLDLLGQLLQFEPNERSKAAPLRAHALFKCARIEDLKKKIAKDEETRLKSDAKEKAVEQAAAAARAAEAVQSAEEAAAAKEAASLQCLAALLRKAADEAKMAQAVPAVQCIASKNVVAAHAYYLASAARWERDECEENQETLAEADERQSAEACAHAETEEHKPMWTDADDKGAQAVEAYLSGIGECINTLENANATLRAETSQVATKDILSETYRKVNVLQRALAEALEMKSAAEAFEIKSAEALETKSAEAHARAEPGDPERPQKISGSSVRQAERRKAQRSAAPPTASPVTVEGASACPSRGPAPSVTVEQPAALFIVAEPQIQSNEPMRCDDNTKLLKQQVHSQLE